MAGLYPDNEVVNAFGTEVIFPGLDPGTHKFTNGDFSNPLVKPSFIPAETVNLILDNLQTLISGLGLTPNNTDSDQLLKAITKQYLNTNELLNFLFPVGYRFNQGFNCFSPSEMGLPGDWEIWNDRADGYGLLFGALPNYTPYTPWANYATGSHVLYHIPGDDWCIYKALGNITNAPQDFAPVKWIKLQPDIIVERKYLQEWTDDDWVIGDVIPSGPYAGWKVCEVIVPGGKYEAAAGGNRPPFGSGTAGDAIRNLAGWLGGSRTNFVGDDGLFYSIPCGALYGTNTSCDTGKVGLDTSRIVPTAPENCVRTLSKNRWRRVA